MKISLAVLIIVLLAGNVAAQTVMAAVDVPFEFVVSGTTFPAGHYNLIGANKGSFLTVQNTDSGLAILVPFKTLASNPNTACAETKMIFTQTTGQHVLHQLCAAGEYHSHDLVHGTEFPQPTLAE